MLSSYLIYMNKQQQVTFSKTKIYLLFVEYIAGPQR